MRVVGFTGVSAFAQLEMKHALYSSSSRRIAGRLFGVLGWIGLIVAGGWLWMNGFDERPMHADEAEQGMLFVQLLDEGEYKYNPRHFHGPTLYYMTLPFAWLRGQASGKDLDETTLRLVPAVFGLIFVFTPLFFRRELGNTGVWVACGFLLFSPGILYYSHYYVHEMLLLAGFGVFAGCYWRYLNQRSMGWSIGSGLAAGFMFATKESALPILIICIVAGTFAYRYFLYGKSGTVESSRYGKKGQLAGAFLAGLVVVVPFYTSFGGNPSGIVDAFRSFYLYETVSGHNKHWSYYLELLAGWNRTVPLICGEGALVMAFFAGIAGTALGPEKMPQRRALAVYHVLYGGTLLGLLSLVSYKTPWLMLGVLFPMALIAGSGINEAFLRCRNAWQKVILVIGVLVLFGFAVRESHWVTRVFPADARNPYAYVHTSRDLPKLVERIQKTINEASLSTPLQINVMAEEYWPLPWYLRMYENTGYWNEIPDAPYSHMMIVSATLADELNEEKLENYTAEFRGLRPGIILLLYIHEDLQD